MKINTKIQVLNIEVKLFHFMRCKLEVICIKTS